MAEQRAGASRLAEAVCYGRPALERRARVHAYRETHLKAFGGLVLFASAVVGGYALFVFDTSISTGLGRVHNLGLLQDR